MATFIDLLSNWNGGRGRGAQTALSKEIGVSQSAISRWISGEMKPEAYLRPRLAKILGVSLNELNSAFPEAPEPASFRSMGDPIPVVAIIKDSTFDFSFTYRTGESADIAIPHQGNKQVAALRVSGSALKPDAEDGDLVIVVESTTEEIPNGGLALVKFKGKHTLLKIKRENGRISTKPRGKIKEISLAPEAEGQVVGSARFLLKRFSL